MRSAIGFLSIFCALAPLSGCEPKPIDDSATAPLIDSTEWPYWPVSMRIHPLTRIVREAESDDLIIETRIEFHDRDGQNTRCFGELRIDLHDETDHQNAGPRTVWNLDLSNLETNQRQFDAVTRTYLLRLESSEAQLSPRPQLRAYFLSVDGAQLQARILLRTE